MHSTRKPNILNRKVIRKTPWFLVDIRLVSKLDQPISLRSIKEHGQVLGDLPLIRKGNRLSVMPVAPDQWDYIMSLKAA